MRWVSPTPERTAEIAASLALALDPGRGAVLCLSGPLGAGKTHFVKGLAEGLGLDPARVQSPTFVLAAEHVLPHGGRLVHVDCYRVADALELENAGLLDWLGSDRVLAVEWSERVPEAWPADHLAITLDRDGEAERVIEARAGGPRAETWLAGWRDALGE
ncbi:MAG: tRNA (adenosine(37)-N6)-threonylcarbamoyltransferase complex ATPase subunit type 1 TsaE [Myxococcota bacterium]